MLDYQWYACHTYLMSTAALLLLAVALVVAIAVIAGKFIATHRAAQRARAAAEMRWTISQSRKSTDRRLAVFGR